MIKISLIVSVYNLEEYIQSAIESILPQLNDETELIIINDGSTDDSLNKIKELTKDHSVALYTKPNRGLGSARNWGMTKAKGEYIWFIDGDDEIHPEAIIIFNENIINFKSSDLISFSLCHKRLGESALRIENKLIQLYNVNLNEFLEESEMLPISACCFFFKKTFLDQHNLQFVNDIFFEDNEFMLRTYNKVNRISSISKCLYVYKARPGSIMKSGISEKKIDSVFKIIETCQNMKSDKLKKSTIDEQLYWFVDLFFKLAKNSEHCLSHKERLTRMIKKQNLHKSDSKGVLLNKISFNLFKVYLR